MSAVSETIVREYFELHGFFVRQQRKYIAKTRLEDDEIDFYVWNPRYQATASPLPFVLTSADLVNLARAVVVVKGWHTETFSAAVVTKVQEILRLLETSAFQQAARAFGKEGPFTKILIVPGLPAGDDARKQSIELLQAKGIDAIIPFRTMLHDLIGRIEVNRNYQKSDLLQIIRILKNYDFFREPQLELFKAKRKSKKAKPGTPAQNEPPGPD